MWVVVSFAATHSSDSTRMHVAVYKYWTHTTTIPGRLLPSPRRLCRPGWPPAVSRRSQCSRLHSSTTSPRASCARTALRLILRHGGIFTFPLRNAGYACEVKAVCAAGAGTPTSRGHDEHACTALRPTINPAESCDLCVKLKYPDQMSTCIRVVPFVHGGYASALRLPALSQAQNPGQHEAARCLLFLLLRCWVLVNFGVTFENSEVQNARALGASHNACWCFISNFTCVAPTKYHESKYFLN